MLHIYVYMCVCVRACAHYTLITRIILIQLIVLFKHFKYNMALDKYGTAKGLENIQFYSITIGLPGNLPI